MKKQFAFFAIVCACCVSMPVHAQEYETRHEIGVSTGILSNSDWISVFEDVVTAIVTGGNVSFDDEKIVGPISAEYFYHVSPLIGVGAIASFSTKKSDMSTGGEKIGVYKTNYFTVLPAVKIDWYRSKYFGAYSKLGIGASLRHDISEEDNHETETDNGILFNWQASLIGIEAGSPNFRGFLEAGCGEQGVLVAGLRCRF